MKKLMFFLALITAVITSQTMVAQEKTTEKTDNKTVDKEIKVEKKMDCKEEMKCGKDGKCCEKCAGEKCDGKCCAKCAECKKECKEISEKKGVGKCAMDSTAKCEKHDMKKMKKDTKHIKKTIEEKK